MTTYQSLRQVLREEFDGNPQNVSGNFLRRKILDKGRIWHNHYWCTGELIKNDDYNFPVIEENKKGIVRRCKTYKEIAEYYKCSVDISVLRNNRYQMEIIYGELRYSRASKEIY